jgi:hypothetical protein
MWSATVTQENKQEKQNGNDLCGWFPPQVRAVQSEQVEGVQEHVAAFALATKPLEDREPIIFVTLAPREGASKSK